MAEMLLDMHDGISECLRGLESEPSLAPWRLLIGLLGPRLPWRGRSWGELEEQSPGKWQ